MGRAGSPLPAEARTGLHALPYLRHTQTAQPDHIHDPLTPLSPRVYFHYSHLQYGGEAMDDGTDKPQNSVLDEWQERPLGQIILDWFRGPGSEPTGPQPTEDVPEDAVPVCHHCFNPQEPGAMFCDECGNAVGPHNNIMPFERIASLGEVARSAVGPEAKFTPFNTTGYIVFGLIQYGLLSPIYLFRMYRNYRRLKREDAASPPG